MESIPHLNEIYSKELKDKNLVVIGQDCWEDNDDEVAAVRQEDGRQNVYRVALDDTKSGEHYKGRMADNWMQATGRDGVPTAFLVDTKGTMAWIGHPMELKEKRD